MNLATNFTPPHSIALNTMHTETARVARKVTKKTRTPLLEKLSLHPRNRHRGRYDFAQLSQAFPAHKDFLVAKPFDAN